MRETRVEEWTTEIMCTSRTGESAVRTVETPLTIIIQLAPGDVVVCHFTNTKVPKDCQITIRLLQITYRRSADDIGNDWRFLIDYSSRDARTSDEFSLTLDYGRTNVLNPPRQVTLVVKDAGGQRVVVAVRVDATEIDLINDDTGSRFGFASDVCQPRTEPLPLSITVAVRESPGAFVARLTFDFTINFAVV